MDSAPVESDDEDADLRAVFQDREESDEEEADVSEPMTLHEARSAAQALKIFVQENQAVEAMLGHLRPIEDLVSDMEAITVSARTQQIQVTDFFDPVNSADGLDSRTICRRRGAMKGPSACCLVPAPAIVTIR